MSDDNISRGAAQAIERNFTPIPVKSTKVKNREVALSERLGLANLAKGVKKRKKYHAEGVVFGENAQGRLPFHNNGYRKQVVAEAA